jgi:hypothetical protein
MLRIHWSFEEDNFSFMVIFSSICSVRHMIWRSTPEPDEWMASTILYFARSAILYTILRILGCFARWNYFVYCSLSAADDTLIFITYSRRNYRKTISSISAHKYQTPAYNTAPAQYTYRWVITITPILHSHLRIDSNEEWTSVPRRHLIARFLFSHRLIHHRQHWFSNAIP